MKRRDLLAALGAAPFLALGVPCAAIAAGKKRLAFLSGSKREEFLADHVADRGKVLAEFGWREGSNLEILWYFIEGDAKRVPALVKEIVAAKPDAIWVAGNMRTRALQQATRIIPIFATLPDPVGDGFARSLARPGGNITGLSLGVPETHEKMFELLRVVLPRLQVVALVIPAGMATVPDTGDRLTALIRGAGMDWKAHGVASIEELRSILRTLPKDGRGAAFLWPPRNLDARAVTQAALEFRVPTVAEEAYWAEMGALMSYQLYHEDETRRTVAILDKLLRGADPASIPFELPTKSHFAINRRTASAIGVALPAEIVLRADRVFD